MWNKIKSIMTNYEIYVWFYFVCGMLWFFPFLGVFIDPVCKIAFIWGSFLIIYDFFVRKQIQKSAYSFFQILFLASYGITVLVNIQGKAYMGIKHFLYTAIVFFILNSFLYGKNIVDIKKFLLNLNSTIIIISFIASLLSLLMYIFSISIEITYFGTPIRQGFIDHRLFGVYTSANPGAFFAFLTIILMFLNTYIKHGKIWRLKKFYWINLIVQCVYFSLTLSRGGVMMVYSALAIIIFFMRLPKYFYSKKIGKEILRAICIYIVVVLCISVGMDLVQKSMSYIPQSISEAMVEGTEEIDTIDERKNEIKNKTEVRRIETGDDVSNGRFDIWTGGLRLWTKSPVFGVADARIDIDELKSGKYDISDLSQNEIDRLDKVEGNLHNAYIEVLVNSGIVGLVIFICYAIAIGIKYLKYFFDKNVEKSNSYYVIAFLFSIIGALAINGVVDNRILFDRQDPIGLLFWIYLGAGCALIEQTFKEGEYREKRVAFACDTPLQIVNAINLKENQYCDMVGDIYIYNQFGKAEQVVKRLHEQNIFENVYMIKSYKSYNGTVQKLVTLKRMCFPRWTLNRYLKDDKKIKLRKYNYICFSFITPFALNVLGISEEAEVTLLEDGIGTYSGDILGKYTSTLFKVIAENSKYKKALHPTTVYVYNPNLYQGRIREVRKLNENLQKNILEEIEYTFEYKENVQYLKNRIIYLGQPLQEVAGYNQTDIKKELEELTGKILVRKHPRERDEELEGFNTDQIGNLWELECIKYITDQHVLIGAFSTAQIMPKILKNVEPTLIFTYRINFCQKDLFWKDSQNMIEQFRKMYKKKNRIYEPNTIEELKELIVSCDQN